MSGGCGIVYTSPKIPRTVAPAIIERVGLPFVIYLLDQIDPQTLIVSVPPGDPLYWVSQALVNTDTKVFGDNSTDLTQINILKDGWYKVSLQFNVNNIPALSTITSIGLIIATIGDLNPTLIVIISSNTPSNGDIYTLTLTESVYVTVGQYLQIKNLSTQGIRISSDGQFPRITIEKLNY